MASSVNELLVYISKLKLPVNLIFKNPFLIPLIFRDYQTSYLVTRSGFIATLPGF